MECFYAKVKELLRGFWKKIFYPSLISQKPHDFPTGFTLIEILIIIGVIGLLASMVLVAMGTARERSRDNQRQANLKQISTAMELDFQENTQYLGTSGGINVVPAIGTYLPMVPKDPMDLSPYQYSWANNVTSRKQYCVYTRLERTADGYVCASEKGVITKVYVSGAPDLGSCCF